MMTGRERVMAIIAGETVDRCAYWTGHPHQESWPHLYRYFGCSTPEELYRILGDDLRWVPVYAPSNPPFGCYAECETAADVALAFS